MDKDPNFPAMMWHPTTGENRVFTAAVDVPDGWLDHYPTGEADAEPAKPADAPDAALPMTRDEIKTALDTLRVKYAKNARDATLYGMLIEALHEDLASAGVAFDPEAAAPALIVLLGQPPAQ